MGNLLKLAVVIGFFLQFNHTAQASTSDFFYENATDSPVIKFLQVAKTSIDIEIYEIQDTRVQSIILKAMDQGVKVRVIQESEAVGSNCPVFESANSEDAVECSGQKNFIQKVQSKGGTYVPFAYQQFCGGGQFRCLEHGKIILVDNKFSLISTGNFNATNLCDLPGSPSGSLSTCNRDYSVVSTDPIVIATLSAVFNSDLKGKSYDLASLLRSQGAQKITISPLSLNPILQFIGSAKKSILIQNQYLKNADMNAALIAAAKRGVKVFVVVSSACAFGRPDPSKDASAIDQWKNTYTAFDNVGIKSRIFTKQIKVNGYPGYLHAKAIVVDGSRAWVGSVNGSTQALTENREYGIFISDTAQATKLVNFIVSDFNHPNSESWQESLVCKKD